MQGLSPSLPRQQTQVVISADIPAYRVIEKRGFFDDSDQLWEKDSMIYWEGEPNPGFEPLNELAEERLREYFTFLDKKADEVCAKNGKSHGSLVNAYEARRRLQEMDRKAGRSVNMDEATPIMGGKHRGERRAKSVYEADVNTPMMGHQARYSVAAKQARGSDRKAPVKAEAGE